MSDPTGSILDLLLEHHPALLSVDEVIREMTAGRDEFGARDRIDVGVRVRRIWLPALSIRHLSR